MDKPSLKEKIVNGSNKSLKWVEKAKTSLQDEGWRDITFNIALKVLRYLRNNNISQKDLAIRMAGVLIQVPHFEPAI